MPPACTARSGFIMAGMWNEAAQAIPGWRNRQPAIPDADSKKNDLRSLFLSMSAAEEPTGLGDLLRGTGPWQWGELPKVFLFARGIVYVPGGAPIVKGPVGKWQVVQQNGEEVRCTHTPPRDPHVPWQAACAYAEEGPSARTLP